MLVLVIILIIITAMMLQKIDNMNDKLSWIHSRIDNMHGTINDLLNWDFNCKIID